MFKIGVFHGDRSLMRSLARLSIRPTSIRVGNFWCTPAAAVKRNSERFLRRRRRRKSSKKFGARWPSRPPPVYLHFTIHPRTLHFSEESECQQERRGERRPPFLSAGSSSFFPARSPRDTFLLTFPSPLFSSLSSSPRALLPCWQAAFWVVCMPDILNLKREIKWKAAARAVGLRAMEADEHTHYTGTEGSKY